MPKESESIESLTGYASIQIIGGPDPKKGGEIHTYMYVLAFFCISKEVT